MNSISTNEIKPLPREAWAGLARPEAKTSELETAVTAQEWFDGGTRVLYDPASKRVVGPGEVGDPTQLVHVFQRAETGQGPSADQAWTTFLPGFPDGSYGWSQVDRLLAGQATPRLFVEFVGQGDSDKPASYPYSTIERADLVEAHWKAHRVESTFVVTFDYSSLVLMELLSRQHERIEAGVEPVTDIQGVLIVNGGLFADSHSHPWNTTPLLKTPMGKVGTWIAQRSRTVFYGMMRDLYSQEYGVTTEQLEELYQAIARRDGAAFMSRAAGFVDEHQAHAERWDLARLFRAMRDTVAFHVVGSELDPFEAKQIGAAKERLGKDGLDIRVVPGGHLTTSEHPDILAELILELGSG